MPMDVYHRIHIPVSFHVAWLCFIYLICLFGIMLCFFVPITIHQEYSGYWQDDAFVFYVPLDDASFVADGDAYLSSQKCESIQLSYDTVFTGVLEAKAICPKSANKNVSIHFGTYTILEILIQKWKGER